MRWLALALLGCPAGQDSDPPAPVGLIADAGPDRQAPVGVPVRLDGSASVGAVAWSWDLGDGTSSDQPSVTHLYASAGNRTAILTVTAADGSTRTDTARVTAYRRPAEVPPTNPSTLTRGPDGRIWGVVRDGASLFVFDGTNVSVLAACAAGGEPLGVTVLPAISVLCGEDSRLDPPVPPRLRHFPFGSTVATDVPFPFGSRPFALAAQDGAWTVSLGGTGQLARITGLTTVTLTDVGPDPGSLTLTDAGPVVARFRSPADRGVLYGPDGEIALAYDAGPDTDTGNRGVPNLLTVAAAPDGRTLFVTGTLSNTSRGVWLDGQDLTHETTARAFFAIVDLEDGEVVRRQLDDQGLGGPMAVAPFGERVWVAFPGTRTIFAMDGYTGEIAGSILDAGQGIDGIALSEDGQTLFVNATLDRELRAYDVRDLTQLPPLLGAWTTVDADPLDPQVLRGKQLFHDARDPRIAKDGYLACAVCHPHGDHDGQTWDFTGRGEGLRNTISLLGRAGVGMGPVHWTGNFDEIHDFEHDMRGPFRGTGLMTDADFALADSPLGPPKAGYSADLDALSAYVSSLDASPSSPFPPPEGGVELFEASGCATCHPAPLYTDSALDVRHDVGTLTEASGQRLGAVLDGLDTPTLRGTWDSGPWLHDGSAATLRDAIAVHADAPTDEVSLDLLADFVRSL